jgi:Gas vesicle protein K
MTAGSAPALRLDIDTDDVARGFAQVVLAVAEVIRELLERQAIRRIDAGDLTDAQIERVGSALLRIRDELAELRTAVTPPSTERDLR